MKIENQEKLEYFNLLQSINFNKREQECLLWAVRGKTILQVAKILELSEYVIREYFQSCVNKLKTVNKTETVAEAISNNIIHMEMEISKNMSSCAK